MTTSASAPPDTTLEAARRLRAVTVEVTPGALPDLIRAGGHPGRHLWATNEMAILGCGEALRVPLPAGWVAPEHTALVTDALGSIEAVGVPGIPGCGPLAMGALPYDPARPGYLSIPRLVVNRRNDRAWATVTDLEPSVEEELARLADVPATGPLPDRFELTAVMPHGEWKALVGRAVKVMESGALSKVVLARQVEVLANRAIVLPDTLGRLAYLYPSCAVFHVAGFIGASPETLLRRTGTDIQSHPLAGTVARSGDAGADEALVAALMSSAKDRHEHQLVVDDIAAKLRPFAALDVPAAPSVVPLRNVSHLGTSITGTLFGSDGALPSSLELAGALQPTPAVGGLPVDAALEWQRENEGFDRGCYAGAVGWVDSAGDGDWVLGLRSASVSGHRAVLYAGNGIVAGSDPDAELAETQLKLQALLAAIVRP